MRSRALLAILALVPGCLMARTDARVRQGFHVGGALAQAWTPHAYSTSGDDNPGGPTLPDRDAANLRVFAELQVGYGFARDVDLTWHAGATLPMRNDPYVSGRSDVYPEQLELFFDLADTERWHFGLGVELVGAQAVVTRELSASTALSLSLRTAPALALAQVSLVHAGTGFDVAAFVTLVTPAWGEDRLDLRHELGCIEACDRTTSTTFGLFGVSVTSR